MLSSFDELFNISDGISEQANIQTRTIWGSNGIRSTNFDPGIVEIERMQKEWQEYVRSIPPYNDICQGRGIVICGGGIKYFTCAWVNIQLLRKSGCVLPIEFWYVGDEMTEETIEALKPFHVICKNVLDYTRSNISGFALKPFAILHSSFCEILFLDADNNSPYDPTYLFDIEEYRTFGTIFWPDFWRTHPNNPIWEITATNDYHGFEQESGQILLNKERCWRALNLCLYFNYKEKDYYRMLFGDKDTFRFAWLALGTPFHMIETPVGLCGYNQVKRNVVSRGISIVQHDTSGKIIFIHRTLLKWDVTQEKELVWGNIKRFRTSVGDRFFDHNTDGVKGEIKYFGTDFSGDTESIPFREVFDDLELICHEILADLRKADFYLRFLLHTYFLITRYKYLEYRIIG